MRKEFQETTDIGFLNGDSVSGLSQSLKSHVLESVVSEEVVSINNTPHFKWGQNCDGWWLKNEGQFSVIYETMPAGSCEIKHYHQETEQFFYCLQGQLVIEFEEYEQVLQEQEGISIKAGEAHQVKNSSENLVSFLVISSPNLSGDRVNLEC